MPFSKNDFDCALMDIQMPVMDGLRSDATDLGQFEICTTSRHCDYRKCDERRPHTLPFRGHERFHPKTFCTDILYSTILRWISDHAEEIKVPEEVVEQAEVPILPNLSMIYPY